MCKVTVEGRSSETKGSGGKGRNSARKKENIEERERNVMKSGGKWESEDKENVVS